MDVKRIVLDPQRRSAAVREFETRLRAKTIGQEEAVSQFVGIYQTIARGDRSFRRTRSTGFRRKL